MPDATYADRRPDCPDDEILAALAAGETEAAARSEMLAHIADCARCRAVVASLARAFADPAVAEARTSVTRRPRHWTRGVAVSAGAAAVLFIALFARSGDRTPESAVHRASEIPTGQTPVPISPRGTVERPGGLHWARVTGADRYRVILYRSDGQVLYETELPDTGTPLPDSVPLAAGHIYLWKVDARTGWDRWTASELARFTVAGRAP